MARSKTSRSCRIRAWPSGQTARTTTPSEACNMDRRLASPFAVLRHGDAANEQLIRSAAAGDAKAARQLMGMIAPEKVPDTLVPLVDRSEEHTSELQSLRH